MSKEKRGSKTGKIKGIGRGSDFGIKKNHKISRKSINQTTVPSFNDLDDLELLENIVLELVDFDWDEFEDQRNQSMFNKYLKQPKNNRKSLFKEMDLPTDVGAVQPTEESEEEDNTDDVDTVIDHHRLKSNKFMNEISKEGKINLKFIINFAKNGNKRSAHNSLKELSAQDRIKLKNSMTHARLAKQSKLNRKRNSRRSTILKLNNESQQDKFAKMKGFKSKEHMEKSLERMRGFEELKNETKLNVMARANGYTPPTNEGSKIKRNKKVVNDDDDESDESDENEVENFFNLEEENLEILLEKCKVQNENENDKINLTKIVKNKSRRGKEINREKLKPKDSLTSDKLNLMFSED